MHRLKVDDKCVDFKDAISNARYPEVAENSNRVTPNTKPVHDHTSHYRTALEYLMMYLMEQESITVNSRKHKSHRPHPRNDKADKETNR